MSSRAEIPVETRARSLHKVGVSSGLAAGAWFGGAAAQAKLVTLGLSPYVMALAMVTGVFVARWTLPTLLKGTAYVFLDLRERSHLLIWAILAGALWPVAYTLTVFAIRDVGLSVAFPLWNTNTLVGLFWGWLLFKELRGAGPKELMMVLGGAFAIMVGAGMLAYATAQHGIGLPHRALPGILAALGAALLWGTMFVPFRKAYISGMNPLSFVTVFTVGELVTMSAVALFFQGGLTPLVQQIDLARPVLFWLFLGGFCWVLGDLFQQYAAKYIGIGRSTPLANTNQLWGLVWAVMVFGELNGKGGTAQALVVAGSLITIAGAVAISLAEPPASEQESWRASRKRESDRYQLDPQHLEAAAEGKDLLEKSGVTRKWWDIPIIAAAVGIFVLLARGTSRPPLALNLYWAALLAIGMLGFLLVCGWILWKKTRFS